MRATDPSVLRGILMTRRTRRFVARSEDGTEHVIHVLIGFILARPLGGPPELLEEEPEFRTADGHSLEKEGPGVYRVLATGQLLRSSDPEAA